MSTDEKKGGGGEGTGQKAKQDEPNKETAAEAKKKSPLFRMTRLDGRDTLKYEDTADK
jgi:hypothetical protein